MFQSSPGSEAGCNLPRVPVVRLLVGVPILTRLGSRVQPFPGNARVGNIEFQSSPGSEAGCNFVSSTIKYEPGVTFQSSPGSEAGCNCLTLNGTTRSVACSNPHPARKPGATSIVPVIQSRMLMFQSSPGSEAGCNANRRRPVRLEAVCSNPHPARKPGATPRIHALSGASDRSNPHPARKPGAT